MKIRNQPKLRRVRVTGGIRLRKDAQQSGTRGPKGVKITKVLKIIYCINKIKNEYKDVENKIKLLTH
jgi:hypothetical protein